MNRVNRDRNDPSLLFSAAKAALGREPPRHKSTVLSGRSVYHFLCVIRRWLSFDSRQKAVLQSIVQDKTTHCNGNTDKSMHTVTHILFLGLINVNVK